MRLPDLSRPKPAAGAAVLSGLLAALGQVPFGLLPLGLAGVVLLLALLGRGGSRGRAAWLGWLAGFAYFALVLHWIVEPFLVDPARTGWMAPFALLFMAGGLALFWAAAGWVTATARPSTRLVAAAAALALAEWLRGTILTGFPWAPLGLMASEGQLAGLLASFGPYGLTFLLLLWSAAALTALTQPRRALPLVGLSALALIAALFGIRPELASAPTPVVRLIQPNAAQHLKWDPRFRDSFFERAVALSADDERPTPDLILWPESSIPPWLNHAEAELAQIGTTAAAPVLAGVRRYQGQRYYNSAVLITSAGTGPLYDKHHLVPFGEYMPLGGLAARMGLHGLASEEGGGYSAGPPPTTLDFPGIGRIRPLICYEAVFARYASLGPRPDMLANLTNDAWFGAWAGPRQHLAHARARAVEQGLPMIRAANTGISAIIAPDGRIMAALALGVAGSTQATLPRATEPTLYARSGDLPVILLMIATVLTMILWRGTPND